VERASLSDKVDDRLNDQYFTFMGGRYPYLRHPHNNTWINERTVEVPFFWDLVNQFQGKPILEVGNVLSQYYPIAHVIVDKYELAPRVQNEDVVEFTHPQEYALIISISTLEHVGWDEQPRDPSKCICAVHNMKKHLAPGGLMVVSIPVGQNLFLDQCLVEGILGFTSVKYLKRVPVVWNDDVWIPKDRDQIKGLPTEWLPNLPQLFPGNAWVECVQEEIKGIVYGHPFPCANALAIASVYNL